MDLKDYNWVPYLATQKIKTHQPFTVEKNLQEIENDVKEMKETLLKK